MRKYCRRDGLRRLLNFFKMNAFLSALEKHDIKSDTLTRDKLTTLQVNMGNLCNQRCLHCHIEASPQGENIMQRKIVDDILNLLAKYKIKTLDITGGAAELNPHFDYLVIQARPLVEELIVRSNLTVLFEPGKEYLPKFFKKNRAYLICSLPCYTKENVDRQRGNGVFEKSIKALQLLNELGFSKEEGLYLDLVYNPMGGYLPSEQAALEKDYKLVLKTNYGIEFNRLLTITNAPIKRFRDYLESKSEYGKYFNLLESSFSPDILEGLMCRRFLSVGFDGRLYDCDFNLALGLALKDKDGRLLNIEGLNPKELEGREITLGEHCLSCTAGSGSSCQGALANKESKIDKVKNYYGKVLKNKNDLKTNACCSTESPSSQFRDIMNNIAPEILSKFYGCGSPIPPILKGCTVLDLGCGSGRDVYLASYLVGEDGFVIGVDMTEEQLEVARKYQEKQRQKFGFRKSNVKFEQGYIEDLKEIGIEDNSIDVVISNCVINLSPNKRAIFSEIFRVLKVGGELYFSDIFAGRRVPEQIKDDPVLYGECLGGALYIEDFRRILREVGCLDYRIVSKIKISITEPEIKEKAGMIDFYSLTIRAFKLDDLEDICEDYGQVAIYLGTITGYPHEFRFDNHHVFITDKPMLVCGNTASMLSKTRYIKHFKIIGGRNTHFGLFKCSPYEDKLDNGGLGEGGSCC